MDETCTMDQCGRPVFARMYCQRHYYRLLEHGDPAGGRALNGDVADAYWRKVDKRGPDECWPWLGAHTDYPRGQIRVNGHTRTACRIGWELIHGEPPSKNVLHTCDNAMCHNPAHWYLGTQRQNLQDMTDRGRRKGPPKVTTAAQDAKIRTLLDRGLSQRQVSLRLGISRWVVSQISLGRRT